MVRESMANGLVTAPKINIFYYTSFDFVKTFKEYAYYNQRENVPSHSRMNVTPLMFVNTHNASFQKDKNTLVMLPAGLEPAIFCLQSKRVNQLRHRSWTTLVGFEPTRDKPTRLAGEPNNHYGTMS